MQKMLTLFLRDFGKGGASARDVVTPGAEWVADGEGTPTQKLDGSCCLVRDGVLLKRYDAKHGKTPPPGFEPAQPDADPVTGHWPGWMRVGDGPEDRMHRDAWSNFVATHGPITSEHNGTYELLGPKVNGNPEGAAMSVLVRHGSFWRDVVVTDAPRDFAGLRDYFASRDVEGIVFHHPDGRMVKIKKSDFGMKRRVTA